MTDKETADSLRGMVRRVTLKNVKDTGETQTASIEVADGIFRDDVEIHQPYGFASSVPEDGALGLALAIGGDQGDIVVIPAANPSKRMGKLNPEETGIYNASGDKIVLGADGSISIMAGADLTVKIGGVTFQISGDGVDITGGFVRHNGKNIGSTHHHSDVTPGAGETGDPLP
jgi:phage baseplate assembly protein V